MVFFKSEGFLFYFILFYFILKFLIILIFCVIK